MKQQDTAAFSFCFFLFFTVTKLSKSMSPKCPHRQRNGGTGTRQHDNYCLCSAIVWCALVRLRGRGTLGHGQDNMFWRHAAPTQVRLLRKQRTYTSRTLLHVVHHSLIYKVKKVKRHSHVEMLKSNTCLASCLGALGRFVCFSKKVMSLCADPSDFKPINEQYFPHLNIW